MFETNPAGRKHRHRHPQATPQPAERVMRIAPLDLRQQRFKTALRGLDRTEVVAFLTEAADDYEHALREIDRLRAGSPAHGGPPRRAP